MYEHKKVLKVVQIIRYLVFKITYIKVVAKQFKIYEV
jgi:hypothetical protein